MPVYSLWEVVIMVASEALGAVMRNEDDGDQDVVVIDEERLFVDALVAMAVANDGHLDAREREAIEPHATSPKWRVLIEEALQRTRREALESIVASSMRGLPGRADRLRLAGALIDVAGASASPRVEAMWSSARSAGNISDDEWAALRASPWRRARH